MGCSVYFTFDVASKLYVLSSCRYLTSNMISGKIPEWILESDKNLYETLSRAPDLFKHETHDLILAYVTGIFLTTISVVYLSHLTANKEMCKLWFT